MPPRTGRAAESDQAATPPRAAAGGGRRSTASAGGGRSQTPRRGATAEMALQTFAQAVGARSFEPHGDADNDGVPRSFHLTVGDVERAKATADGVQHRAYGTQIEDDIPHSLSAFITEAIRAACTYYEDLLNNGEEFRRIRNLSRGPSPEGARRGAAKRAANRAAAKGSDSPAGGS